MSTTESLEKFIIEKQSDLDKIRESLNEFNIFNVLGVQHREIRHSNFLGWLFDPNESHQLGDRFLKDLLHVIREKEIIDADTFIPLLLRDLSGTRVARETENNIDILIVNEELGFVICIENKINANYSDHQLKKYYDYVEKTYNHLNTRLYLTLTPFPNRKHKKFEKGEYYTNISYAQIITILKNHKIAVEKAQPTIRESIKQYITMVERDITYSGEEIKLAQEIYKKYQKEIDFIVAQKPDFKSKKAMIQRYFDDRKDFIVTDHREHNFIVRILPNDEKVNSSFKDARYKSWLGHYYCCIEIIIESNDVWLKWCVGSIHDVSPDERIELQAKKTKLIEALRDMKCFTDSPLVKIGKSSPDASYSGVCTVDLFTYQSFLDQDAGFLTYFKEKFEEANEKVIQPWINDWKALNWKQS